MNKITVLFLIFVGLTSIAFAQDEATGEREQIRWDLTDLYESEAVWETARDDVKARIPQLEELREGFGANAESLASSFEQVSALRKDFYRVAVYASLLGDEDQRVPEGQVRNAEISSIGTSFGEATAWMRPALLELGEETLLSYIEDEPRLAPFDYDIKDLIRSAPHMLDEKGEKMLASSGTLSSSPYEIYSLLANADIPWPEVTLSHSEEPILLNQAGYTGARSLANREDRKKVFEAFFATWKDYEDSMGATLNTEVQANIFQAKARNYESVLQWQLSQENLPEAVYRTLVEQVNDNVATLHRYFKLRGEILEIEDLGYFDIYPPLVEMDTDFSVE
ncbi:MAG: hypothetical protein KTR16_03730, partial [Acidiferrobacterales bacterium]|nr:hypothetical protein [Acidiferrobacterales bacterium]